MKHIIALTLCLVSNITLFASGFDLTVDNGNNLLFPVRVAFHAAGTGGSHDTIIVKPGETKTVEGGTTSFMQVASSYSSITAVILVQQPDGTFKDGAAFRYINHAHQREDQKISFTVQAPKRPEDPAYFSPQGYVIMHYFPAQKSKEISWQDAQTPGLVFTF